MAEICIHENHEISMNELEAVFVSATKAELAWSRVDQLNQQNQSSLQMNYTQQTIRFSPKVDWSFLATSNV